MRAVQLTIRDRALAETQDHWLQIDPFAPYNAYEAWLRLMIAMVQRFRSESIAAAQVSYNEMRRQLTDEVGGVVLPHGEFELTAKMVASLIATGPGRMRQLIALGYSPDQAHKNALVQLSGVVTKQTMDAGRDAVMEAMRDDSEAIGYARVARPKACAFCRMLAGRGAVYTKKSVEKVIGSKRNGTQPIGATYHDECKCFGVPVFSNDQGLPDANKQHAKDWADSTAGLGGKEALAAFRAYTGAH